MARKRRTTAKWASLNSDLLLHVFHRLEPLLLLSTVAFVCRPWGRVCFNRFLTGDGEETLDLGGLKSDDTGLLLPTRRVGKAGLMKLIRAVMDVYSCDDGHGDGTRVAPFTKMVFHFGPFVWCDAHLVYVAERSPDLRELTLSCGSEITHKGFSRALCYWNEIEKMSIGPFQHNYDVYRIIEAAGIISKKLEVLSLAGFFINQQLSPQISQNLKGVKLLRLEKAYIGKVALKNILSKCKKLQKVEIWHCLTLEGNESDLLASCEIKKTEVDGVIKWSLVGDAEPHNLKNLLNLFWQ